MASTEGGVEIEKVAEETPEKIHKLYVDMKDGLDVTALAQAAKDLGIE